MIKNLRRFEVYLTTPTPKAAAKSGRKEHCCMVVSPDKRNADPSVGTVLVAPIASEGIRYPNRVHVHFGKKEGLVLLDHARVIAKMCVVKRLGKISAGEAKQLTLASREYNL